LLVFSNEIDVAVIEDAYQDSNFWTIYLTLDQHDHCTCERAHLLTFLMWGMQSVDLEGTPTWPVSPMYRPTTGSQISPTTAPVQQLPRQQLSSASIRQGLVAPMLPLRARHRKQASRTISTGPDQPRRLDDSAVMMAGAVVPSASPRGPTEQPRVMSMQTETNPESVQPAKAQRPAQSPTAVMELPDLDRRNSSITAAQRATGPSFWSDAVLIELSDSGEE
jgi:hypothetical protein